MKVDTAASAKLSRRIARASGDRLARLRRERAAVDERFDGNKALAATGRYLKLAREEVGREDLAFVSYHMGIGNLQGVLSAFGEGDDVSYAQVYFDSSFDRHAEAYGRLIRLGDDSSNYYWKVLAGREIMRLWRDDRARAGPARRAARRQGLGRGGAAPRRLDGALRRPRSAAGGVGPRRDRRASRPPPAITGLAARPADGRAGRAGWTGRPALYRGLRPEALALAMYIGAQVRALSDASPLIVTSTVRDEAYQRELVRRNREATRNYSLHTTGWAFDIERRYASRRQALAFQSVLDRLRCSAPSPGCASRTRSTSRSRARRRRCCRLLDG